MKSLTLISAVILFAHSAFATLTLNTPNANWMANATVFVTWIYTPEGTPNLLMDMDVVAGPDSDLKAVASIGKSIPAYAGMLGYQVPGNLNPAVEYAIRATGPDLLKFSGRFKIEGGYFVPSEDETTSNATNAATTNHLAGPVVSLAGVMLGATILL